MVWPPERRPRLSDSKLGALPQKTGSRRQGCQAPATSTGHLNDESGMALPIECIVGQSAEDEAKIQRLGVMFRDLRVVGPAVGVAVQHNLASVWDPRTIIKYIMTLRRPPVRDILSGFEGVVRPGEMLLVLGLPGSGCSTFLKTLANHRGDYSDVQGDVFYNSFVSKEIDKEYRGDVIYCPEDDVHFPTLSVEQTLDFASAMRNPSHRANNERHPTEALMRIFGIGHAKDTVIGDAALRGISGGEKRRVSLAETMSARGKLVCWDNPTRGLDSSTALQFIRTLRVATDQAKVTTVVALYQAGEQMFSMFDKVCLIYEGRMAYFGSAKEAKRYFTDMGFEPQCRQATPDFLVAVTDPHGRKFRPGSHSIPRTADEMAAYFRTSTHGQLNRSSIAAYTDLYIKPEVERACAADVKSKFALCVPDRLPYALSIPMQVRSLMRRRWQILKGDRATQATQVGSQIIQAVFLGTVFLQVTSDTSEYFSRGSLLFLYEYFINLVATVLNAVANSALFCGSTLCLAEIPGSFFQRTIILRHQKGALYYPFIEGLAHTVVDIPISLVSITLMTLIFYFLVGLQQSWAQLLTYLLFTFTVTLVMKYCFRAIAAFSGDESSAVPAAGLTALILILYTGYVIPLVNIVGSLRWLAYLNPLRYAFESLMVNEFHTINGTCTTLVPSGPGYENATLANQVCATIGSQPGMATVPGDAYLHVALGYSYSHLWRNFGIMWAFVFTLLGALLLFNQYNTRTARDTTVTLYKEGSRHMPISLAKDEEKVIPGDLHEKLETDTAHNSISGVLPKETRRMDILAWRDIQYEVRSAGGGISQLLDNISGYVTPGRLTALMGESGAGKTVLLDILAQRISGGVVHGDCLLNGHPLPVDFRAQTAYVQQMDTHIAQSTVREALLFSAKLRQPQSVPTEEKEAYVDYCLKVCGLDAYADAIVGSLGVEQRKRTTIGVELAAKPKLLLFLDEPTSGLDSQAAWAIVTFLRELANDGQAILCTIHQPSGELFQLFDKLLLLQKGGRMVYFGDIGEGSKTVIEYFQRNGAPRCPADANPAEYMLDVIGAGAPGICTTNWPHVWNDSPEAARLDLDIDRIYEDGRSRPVERTESRSEFASSWMKQVALLTLRGFVCNWRNPTYIYSKLVVCVVAGLMIGFTFLGATNSLQGCQDKFFSIFVVVAICVPLAQQSQGKILESRTVYEVRERPARMFTWSAFLVSEILIETPWNMLGSSVVFFCWYWTSGFDSSRAPFSYLFYSIVFPVYFTTFGQAVAIVSPNGAVASILFTVLFTFVLVFAGALQPYSQLGWWQWMYYISPFTYVIAGLSGQAIGNQLITCAPTEFVTIEPPEGTSCSTYMDPYIAFAGGYLADPDASTSCAFCPFATTDAYMQLKINVSYGHHWRDLTIVLGIAVFNVAFMFAGMYFFRVRGGKEFLLARFRRLVAKVKRS